MAKSYEERIAETKLKIEQEQNRMKQLIQKQKKEERNARTKRLCSRMGLFESMLPNTIPLTDEQFKTFLEKTVLTEHSRHILDGLTAQNAAAAEQDEGNGARVMG